MNSAVIFLMPLAFICEFIDSSLGMGYGTSLTPILLLMGYSPLEIVPAVLFSEFISGILSACFHHEVRNVEFTRTSLATRVALLLSACSVIGAVVSVSLAISLPARTMKIMIGAIVVTMGVIILLTFRRAPRFSWTRMSILGAVASFNKGVSGGGYGPLVMGGQMLSGIGVKNAVAITSLAEGVTCCVGVVLYYFLNPGTDWFLAPWLMAGAVLSVPVAAYTVKRIPEQGAKLVVALLLLILGLLTLAKSL